MNAAAETKNYADFKVADLSLADWGRKEIATRGPRCPASMAIREEFAPRPPLRGARIAGSLHMTIQTAVLIETLRRSAPRCAGRRATSTRRRTTRPPRSPGGTPVFAVKGETLAEYWEYTHRIFEWKDGARRT